MAEKVQFNLKNVHYAVLTESSGAPVWSTPVAVPGAVSLTLDANGDKNDFYADGIVYYSTIANAGYTGSLEMARIPESMLSDVWGMAIDGTDKVQIENANDIVKPFALLFQVDTDLGNEYYVFYRCFATRPQVASATNTETKEPQTQSFDITAAAVIDSTAASTIDGAVKAKTTADTPTAVKTAWFSAVYQ